MKRLVNILLALVLAQTLCYAHGTMPRLPPRWRVVERSQEGGHMEGHCSGGLPMLQDEAARHFLAQGWQREDGVYISRKQPRVWLGIWRRQPRERMALLLCEHEVAKWTFRLGRLDGNQTAETPLVTRKRRP